MKNGELTEEEVALIKDAALEMIAALDGQLKIITEAALESYNTAAHDELHSYIAKAKPGFISVSPADTYITIQFYPANHANAKKMFSKAKKA